MDTPLDDAKAGIHGSVFPVSIVSSGSTRVLDYEPALPMSSESTLGAYLRRFREGSGLSVEAVSARSRILPGLVRALEADLSPGTVREWRSPARFRITLGNAGAVELELDGHAVAVLGEREQVVRDAMIPAEGRP